MSLAFILQTISSTQFSYSTLFQHLLHVQLCCHLNHPITTCCAPSLFFSTTCHVCCSLSVAFNNFYILQFCDVVMKLNSVPSSRMYVLPCVSCILCNFLTPNFASSSALWLPNVIYFECHLIVFSVFLGMKSYPPEVLSPIIILAPCVFLPFKLPQSASLCFGPTHRLHSKSARLITAEPLHLLSAMYSTHISAHLMFRTEHSAQLAHTANSGSIPPSQ